MMWVMGRLRRQGQRRSLERENGWERKAARSRPRARKMSGNISDSQWSGTEKAEWVGCWTSGSQDNRRRPQDRFRGGSDRMAFHTPGTNGGFTRDRQTRI